MASVVTRLLIGTDRSRSHWSLVGVLAFALFITTFAAYASGLFRVSGGVLLIPFHAAIVGMLGAAVIGAVRGGLVATWIITYMPFLGFHADHAFLGLPGRPFDEQLAYFVRPDGLAMLAIEAIIVGTLAFALGMLLRWGYDAFARGSASSTIRHD